MHVLKQVHVCVCSLDGYDVYVFLPIRQIRALNSANVLITDSPAEMGVAMKEAMKNAGKL